MSQAKIEATLKDHLQNTFSTANRIGVAVSGGGDSMALLAATRKVCGKSPITVFVATVDHQLRDTAEAEIALVAEFCKANNITWSRLKWTDWDGAGNLQAKARQARRDLLSEWAEDVGLDVVLMGHTKDDVAETFLMRLARGSGVDGLSMIATNFVHNNTHFFRPFLDISRSDLRGYLKASKIPWAEDPSNDDPQFDRVRIRQSWEALEGLGLTRDRLVATAQTMARTREALDTQSIEAAKASMLPMPLGFVEVSIDNFSNLPKEIKLRLVSRTLAWITGNSYRPRLVALEAFLNDALAGKASTLHGCMVLPDGDKLILCREPNAVDPGDKPKVFDNRWATPIGAVLLNQNTLDLNKDCKTRVPKQEILQTLPTMIDDNGDPLEPLPDGKWGTMFSLLRPSHEFFTYIKSH
ncbi:MAG: tRNA lysidine(34) synthetase TilS [Pseudomonadota bacterium]